jgi:hypothetical protein
VPESTNAVETGSVDLREFKRVDFFPSALREAATYLERHTRATDRVQLYGMDPSLLFAARRRSASPFVLAYDLNPDAALFGSFDDGGLRPSDEQKYRISALYREHEDELLARFAAAEPAAFVFVDKSPLMTDPNALVDFSEHCPRAFAWMTERYVFAAQFAEVRIWRRSSQPRPPRDASPRVE